MIVRFALENFLLEKFRGQGCSTSEKKKKKKKRNMFEISTVSSPGATRVQHLFSGYGLRIFVTTIESAGNATAHPACSLNLFYSYSITLGYAFAQ